MTKESQLLRALELGADRLRAAGRLHAGAKVGIAAGPAIAEALKYVRGGPVILPAELETKHPSLIAVGGAVAHPAAVSEPCVRFSPHTALQTIGSCHEHRLRWTSS